MLISTIPYTLALRLRVLAVFFLLTTAAIGQISIDAVHCICGPDGPGRIFITAAGTAGPFSFVWSGPNNYRDYAQNPQGISSPGLYTVIVTNAYGCAVTLSTEVGECPGMDPLSLNATPTCIGANTGAITLEEPTTGTAPYDYEWSNGEDDILEINNLAPGEYQITVTDANGCTQEASATVLSEQVLDLEAEIKPACSDQHNGRISLNVSGGSGAYTYHWSTNGGTSTIEDLAPGIYKVTVTDQDLDAPCIITRSFEVTANAPLVIASSEVTFATCITAGNGAIDLTVNGGAAPYSYLWSNGATTASVEDLNGATYCVTVTDANDCTVFGCYTTSSLTSQAAAPYVKHVRLFAVPASGPETLIYDAEWVTTAAGCVFFTGGTLEISPQLLNAMSLGEIKLRIEAETSEEMEMMLVIGHSFNLNQMQPQGSNIWTRTVPESALQHAVGSNNTLSEEFIFTGTDLHDNPLFNLRLASHQMTKCTDVPQLQPNCSWSPNYSGANLDNVHTLVRKCLQVDFNINFEEGNIRAIVNGGTGPYTYKWREEGDDEIIATGFQISNLEPGRYCISITDAAGCSVQECVTLCPQLEGLIEELIDVTAPCPGGIMDGSICIEAGNTYPLVYAWQNGTSGECISGLLEGYPYCVTVTNLACPEQDPFTHCIDALLAVTAITVVQGTSMPACSGESNGQISAIASGGRPPYTFLWGNGASGPVNDNLAAGSCHSVTVTDACGQTTSQCFNLPAYQQPSIISGSTHAACGSNPTGSINLNVTGGLQPLSFSWSRPDGFTDTTDEPMLNGVASGHYSVTVTDACEGTDSGGPFQVVMVSTSNFIQATPDITHICNAGETGAINLTVQAASPSYMWSTGATTEDVTGLSAGQHSVTITSGSCTVVNFYSVRMANIQILAAEVEKSCNGNPPGSIDIKPSGSFPPFQYMWSNGATTEDLSSVVAGTYTVTVQDAEGCTQSLSIVIENVPDPQIIVSNITNPLLQQASGSIELEVSGNGPFDYAWSNGAQTEDIASLSPGTYIVTVTDSNHCSSTEVVDIVSCVQPPPNTLFPFEVSDIQVTPLTEPNSGDGAIQLVIAYGSLPLFYEWTMDNNSNFKRYTEDISGLAEGRYCVTVTDGCTVWTHCQRVAYCGDFSIEGHYNEDACLYPGGPSIALNVNVFNRNGGIRAQWNDETALHGVQGSSQFSRSINSGQLFGTETMAGSLLWKVLVEDEATCSAEYEFNLVSVRAVEDARWNLKYFNLIDPIESQAYYGLTALADNSQYAGFPISPYTNACNRFMECDDQEIQVNHNASLGCKSCGSANEYGNCNLCTPISEMCVACSVAPDFLTTTVEYIGSHSIDVPLNVTSSVCRKVEYCLYFELGTGYPFIFRHEIPGTFNCSNPYETVDSDGDGIVDSDDNCPFIYNPSPQLDCDMDGEGNECDSTPGVTYGPVDPVTCQKQVTCSIDGTSAVVSDEEHVINFEECITTVTCKATGEILDELSHWVYCKKNSGTNEGGHALCQLVKRCTLTNVVVNVGEVGLCSEINAPYCDIALLPPTDTSENGLVFRTIHFANNHPTLEKQTILIVTDLFPNPFTSELTIAYNSEQNLSPVISIRNIQGVVLHTRTQVFEKGGGRVVVNDLADLPPGAYFISIADVDSGYFFTRMVVRQ